MRCVNPIAAKAGIQGNRRTRGQVWIPAYAGMALAETTRAATASTGRSLQSARKWRRNGLKRLNPGPEMVVCREPLTHNIWYTGAQLTVRDSGGRENDKVCSRTRDERGCRQRSPPGNGAATA